MRECYKYVTPFGWIPASRSFSSIDAIICTDRHIITVQVTVASSHTAKLEGFASIKASLPSQFQKSRKWCHVFLSDDAEKARRLRSAKYSGMKKENISIYSGVLDFSRSRVTSDQVRKTEEARTRCEGKAGEEVPVRKSERLRTAVSRS
jgi:hypothetical protein